VAHQGEGDGGTHCSPPKKKEKKKNHSNIKQMANRRSPAGNTDHQLTEAWELFEDEGNSSDEQVPSNACVTPAPAQRESTGGGGESTLGRSGSGSGAAEAEELLHAFVEEHLARTCLDLSSIGQPDLARTLQHMRAAAIGCRGQGLHPEQQRTLEMMASQVSDAAWTRLVEMGGWDHVCWREAFVFAKLFSALSLLHHLHRSGLMTPSDAAAEHEGCLA